MGKLYDELNALDPWIAGQYSAATRGKGPNDKLGVDFADLVFNRVMKDTAITTKEAGALVLLIDRRVFSVDAAKHLAERLSKEGADAIQRGATQLKKGSKELDRFNHALDLHTVRHIDFWSPATNHFYRPLHYVAISQLIDSGAITVWSMDTAGLSQRFRLGSSGEYVPSSNRFIMDVDNLSDRVVIVHEATHAIQDWRDMSSAIAYLEADAYVAEAVVTADFNLTAWMSREVKWAVDRGLPDLVFDKKAVQGNADWKDAYEDLVTQVLADPTYGARSLYQEMNMAEKRPTGARGPTEQQQMEALRQALKRQYPAQP